MKHILISITLLLTTLTIGWSATQKPNIIFILVDDMGFSDISCYGGEIETPNFDRLAKGGLRFTQIHNTAKCFPSRATLLTGLYAQDNGMSHSYKRLSNAVTLGEVLKSAGYRTLASGKHHSEESLFDRGFDHYFGLLDGATNHFNPGLQRKGEPKPAQKKYGKRKWAIDDKVLTPYTPPEKDFYSTDIYTEKAIDYLKKYKKETKPFFLYLSYTAPHDPLQAWTKDVNKYNDTYKVGYSAIREARIEKLIKLGVISQDTKVTKPTHRSWDRLSDEQKEIEARKMAIYAAMIDRVDQQVGKLLETLETMDKLDNTLIIFASDNGSSAEFPEKTIQKKGNRVGDGVSIEKMHTIEYWASLGSDWANVSNTPFQKNKTSSYQGGVCTPFIVHWPKVVANPGSINKTFVGHFIDVMATFVDITGANYPSTFKGKTVKPMAGESFLPQLRGDMTSKRKSNLYWQWSDGRAIRSGKWKTVSTGNDWELFNMEADVNETQDVSEEYPEVFQRLQKQWKDWYKETGAPAFKVKGKRSKRNK